MRISRLYLPEPLAEGATLRLDEDSAHYLKTVLRLKRGFHLTVFNGDGHEYAATVAEVHKDGVVLAIGAGRDRDAESPLATHLGLGIARGERMDLAIQKAVELGVTRITPLFTEHCVVRLDETRKTHRHSHWQKIVRSACEQCGRNRVPQVDEPVELEDWIGGQAGLKLFFDPEGTARLKDLPPPEGGVCLLSGPEGGFAERERTWAREAGFVPVRLGPRILRAETAVLAALAAAQVLWGDWGSVAEIGELQGHIDLGLA
ncbi:16S rRNA (uracil1498-N3)-methyltransferase [Methylomagnum ishizawai]|uniref:Ribosomal RNA small subunit methyltransferase E n=1 Tax=Methylomagnum ishizawai TaxID=1760988 RepID=A0A1Y6CS18_9GAMM|nr:16S rRNA (uracil(1498)-N(3))-methyltransferase [Methylomagnum ishizawai]SMF93418.1 16S rRNA (uracil1498-N3)-methyltransferase [Methylomagnum ishizawai]